jgi:flagellin
MGLRINQNIAAQNAYRSLSVSDNQMSKSLEKLSSGFRINRAADDAAGLAISEGLRSQVGGMKVAVRNAQDGVSVVQTAEGALNEVHSILQRMRDLGVQAGNDSNNTEARNNIATEVSSLTDELERIGNTTNFNGRQLLAGGAPLTFQVGAAGDANSKIDIDLSSANVVSVATQLKQAAGAAGNGFAIGAIADGNTYAFSSTKNGVTTSITTAALTGVGATSTTLAAKLNTDANFKANFIAETNGAALVVRAKDGGTVAATNAHASVTTTGAANSQGLSFADNASARLSVDAIDAQIKSVSTARAKLGAYQNRFEHTINNANVTIENLSASESRIRDTDMAQEMMSYTRSQILTQAGTSMLAQANQSQQGVLSLLR